MARIKLREKPISPRPDHSPAPGEIEDFSDLIAARQYCWKRLSELTGEDWGWNHPRVRAYLDRCKTKNEYFLPYGRYKHMVDSMLQMVQELEAILLKGDS